MKKIILLIVFIAVTINPSIAQNDRLCWIGVNASVSTGELVRFGGRLDGGASYKGKIGFQIGIDFSRVINDRFAVESGIDFSRNSFNSSYIDDMGHPVRISDPEHVDLLTIPFNLKINIKKQFFITGGIQYDQRFNVTNSQAIDNQTGIGLNMKFSRDFKIADKMMLHVSPEILIHDIVPFYPENHQQRLTEFGLRICYRLGL
jgi:hypothetical protein